jgi:hypothetical protein
MIITVPLNPREWSDEIRAVRQQRVTFRGLYNSE